MPSVQDLAELSLAAYDVTPKATDWNLYRSFNGGSPHFSAALFYRPSTDECVLAYRGTDDVADLFADVMIALGRTFPQYRLAERYFLYSRDKYVGSSSFWLTGHSLGGGLASMVAAKYDVPVVTFNAPGVLRSYSASSIAGLADAIAGDASKMLNIRAAGDPVSIGTGPRMGRVLKVPNKRCYTEMYFPQMNDIAPGTVSYMLCTHSMRNLRDVLKRSPEFAKPITW